MEKNAYYPGLDLFKFIAAIFILLLYANPLGNESYGGIIFREVITLVAVPFFFTASAFLWYGSYIVSGRKKANERILRTVKLYLIWSGIYFPFVLLTWIINHACNFSSVILYVKRFLLEGSFQTIWFLNALWLATALVYFLLKHFSIKQIFLLSLPFYVLSCPFSSWHGQLLALPMGGVISDAYYSTFETTKNGLLFSFAYVALGALVAEWRQEKLRGNREKARCIHMHIYAFLLAQRQWCSNIFFEKNFFRTPKAVILPSLCFL